jgi:hypothetical protein
MDIISVKLIYTGFCKEYCNNYYNQKYFEIHFINERLKIDIYKTHKSDNFLSNKVINEVAFRLGNIIKDNINNNFCEYY